MKSMDVLNVPPSDDNYNYKDNKNEDDKDDSDMKEEDAMDKTESEQKVMVRSDLHCCGMHHLRRRRRPDRSSIGK